MSIPEHTTTAGPAEVLADALALVRAAAETLWSARSDDELIDTVGQVQQLVAAAAAVEAGAVAEADARDLAKQRLQYGSTGDWLTHTGGLHRGEGKRRVVRARALTGALTATMRGLVDGTVSPGQADIIVRSVEDLPSGDLVRRRGEKVLLRQAASLDASELARAGRHLAAVVDPDTVDRRLEAQLEREERAAHLTRYLSISPDRAGGVRVRGRGTAEDGALLLAALMPLTCPEPTTNPDTDPNSDPAADPETGEEHRDPHDPRDHGTRLWDALIATAQHALTTTLPPETHGTPARLLVTLDHHTLKNDLAARRVGTTADGTDLPPDVLRRLACDAEVIPAVLGTHGEVLDLGRLRRLVTTPVWTALVVRDRHCTFPACRRPPLMCHAHHLHHWADGGTTDLDNLALLCGHHHRTIHHTPWEIRLNPTDRQPEFKPPPTLDTDPAWIRYRPRRE